MTNGEYFKAAADKLGIPRRTLNQVRTTLARAKKQKSDVTFARLMRDHGRLTDEAMAYVNQYLAEAA